MSTRGDIDTSLPHCHRIENFAGGSSRFLEAAIFPPQKTWMGVGRVRMGKRMGDDSIDIWSRTNMHIEIIAEYHSHVWDTLNTICSKRISGDLKLKTVPVLFLNDCVDNSGKRGECFGGRLRYDWSKRWQLHKNPPQLESYNALNAESSALPAYKALKASKSSLEKSVEVQNRGWKYIWDFKNWFCFSFREF